MEGWIKLHRKLLKNPIFKNANLYHLYSYCLLKARHEEGEVMFGETVIKLNPGEFVTGRNVLSEALNEKPNTTYKRLKKLEKLNYVSLKSNNKNTLVTVLNWESYQIKKEEVTTESQQSNNKVTTESQQSNTNKKLKNEKKNSYGEYSHVKLTKKEFENFVSEIGLENLNYMIKKVDEYVESNRRNKPYTNYNLVIRNWMKKENIKTKEEIQQKRQIKVIVCDREGVS